MHLSWTEQLAYSTVRIECQTPNGISVGTGFFFSMKPDSENNTHMPVVITNKHVVRGATKGSFFLNRANANNEPINQDCFIAKFSDFETLWINHPDPEVDLCAMPVAYLFDEARKSNEKVFYTWIDKSIVPTEEVLKSLTAVEEIIMIGYPNGIWDSVNNKPLFRKGITATSVKYDYNGRKEFMIDAACFPGSSGSPVFLFNEGIYRDHGGTVRLGESRVIFLGVLYAGPQYAAEGTFVIKDIPTIQTPAPVISFPINLGFVIKSQRVSEIEALL